MDQNLPLTPVTIKAGPQTSSPGRSLKKVILLNVLTFGLYTFRWFYLNWRDFRGKIWPEDILPLFRSLGLVVPILSLFLVYKHFKRIYDHAHEEISVVPELSPGLLTFCWYLQFPLARAAMKMPSWAGMLPILAEILLVTFILASFQRVLNAYWQQTQPELPLQTKFSTGEKIAATLGSFLWIFTLLGSLLPE